MNDFLLMLYWELLPTLLEVIGAILGILLIRATSVARDRWGIEIEARHREALHSALMTGITAALGRKLDGEAVIRAAVTHVVDTGARDAVEFFGLGLDELQRMARSKLHQSQPLIGIDLAGPEPDRSAVIEAK